MMGVKKSMMWFGWFVPTFTVNLLSIIIITILMKVPVWGTSQPPIEFCHFTIYAVLLILYSAATITFCFFISALISNRKY